MSTSRDTQSKAFFEALRNDSGCRIGFWQMTPKQWLATVGLAVVLWSLGALFFQLSSSRHFGWLLIGMGLGSLARDIGIRRRYCATWPLLDSVIDWQAVAEHVSEK